MSQNIRDLVKQQYSLKSGPIEDMLVRWSLSCWPLVKARSSRLSQDDLAIRQMTENLVIEIIQAVGIDVSRPFIGLNELNEARNTQSPHSNDKCPVYSTLQTLRKTREFVSIEDLLNSFENK